MGKKGFNFKLPDREFVHVVFFTASPLNVIYLTSVYEGMKVIQRGTPPRPIARGALGHVFPLLQQRGGGTLKRQKKKYRKEISVSMMRSFKENVFFEFKNK